MGFAFYYIDFKRANDIPNEVPAGKELWVTEGDIHDPSEDSTWLEGIRDGILHLSYMVEDEITMHTPHIYQIDYVARDLRFTAKGHVARAIYGAQLGMTSVSPLILPTSTFNGKFGDGYPDLTAVRLTDGSLNRVVVINASSNSYTNLDFSNIISSSSRTIYSQGTNTPWILSDVPSRTTSSYDPTNVSIAPYSINVIAEDDWDTEWTASTSMTITNNNPEYVNQENNLVLSYDFGDIRTNSADNVILRLNNESNVTLTFDSTSLTTTGSTSFYVFPLSVSSIPADSWTWFRVRFNPPGWSDNEFTGTLHIRSGSDTISLDLKGRKGREHTTDNVLLNYNYDIQKDPFDTDWSLVTQSNATAGNGNTPGATSYDGTSFRINVTNTSSSGNIGHVAVRSDSRTVDLTDKQMTMGCYMRTDEPGRTMRLQAIFTLSDSTLAYVSSGAKPILQDVYRKYSHSFNVPAGAVSFQLAIQVGAAEGLYFFDDAFVFLDGISSARELDQSKNLDEKNTNDEDIDESWEYLFYPNPANQEIFFNHLVQNVSIVNTLGQTVLSSDLNGHYSLDISSLQKGMYFIILSDDQNNQVTQKLLVD